MVHCFNELNQNKYNTFMTIIYICTLYFVGQLSQKCGLQKIALCYFSKHSRALMCDNGAHLLQDTFKLVASSALPQSAGFCYPFPPSRAHGPYPSRTTLASWLLGAACAVDGAALPHRAFFGPIKTPRQIKQGQGMNKNRYQ